MTQQEPDFSRARAVRAPGSEGVEVREGAGPATGTVPAGAAMGRPSDAAALAEGCATCGAVPGEPCRNGTKRIHRIRYRFAWRRARAPWLAPEAWKTHHRPPAVARPRREGYPVDRRAGTLDRPASARISRAAYDQAAAMVRGTLGEPGA